LHVNTDSGKRDIDVQVLGAINGRGVAVLLDKTGNVWLYHVHGAVDRPLKNLKHAVAMVFEEWKARLCGEETHAL
jgi:hypothetical protein